MSDRREVLKLFEEQKYFLQEKINTGIEQYRKGYGVIEVKDKSGNLIIH